MLSMAFRYEGRARRRATVAALVGLSVIVVFGPLLAVPAVALVAFVYYAHQLAGVLAGDEGVKYPSLALVIVVNSLVVLLVQLVLVVEGFNLWT
jgi:hypothetical protein